LARFELKPTTGSDEVADVIADGVVKDIERTKRALARDASRWAAQRKNDRTTTTCGKAAS
jgi:hypothetical protein